ncbi:hypothetical protein BB987_12335 [Photorhabdus temperata]|uniref:Uncharacterized protein n=1 Tax=Photorhabdus khanii NC19 TaxID=1004151 RepID=W3VB43_9GAMM|nr:hypothetical protein [Photorhabdus khanii]ETS33146.1 hypothetical protein PTE_00296 [Photorhabdus khanii NC19]OHV53548.1 hypothetical protein BB987_12335 [Photorhabdus temperata]
MPEKYGQTEIGSGRSHRLFNQRLISTVELGVEPGDGKVECILNISTIFGEICVDTYALGKGGYQARLESQG